eukprot:TRINITY_DN865_c3_g2_i1.p1 TRINITY_DN865_c3_g2~~TRINITY_DN865_c3_g2_i1.p1  ORF type:complete len:100 (-),score=12.05 TRINITY_DN865_c3_g2_i1:113-412(-)
MSKKVHTHWILNIAPTWVPDERVTTCFICSVEFGFITRKHHCRNCGKIICNKCSSKRRRLPQFGITEPVRVCDSCFPNNGVPSASSGNAAIIYSPNIDN